MPIYEYACRGCGHEFEQLCAPATRPRARLQGQDLERLLSHVADELGEHAPAEFQQGARRRRSWCSATRTSRRRSTRRSTAKKGTRRAERPASTRRFASVRPSTYAQRVVRGHVRLQRRDRDVAVAHGLVVRAVVRLPLVLALPQSSSTACAAGPCARSPTVTWLRLACTVTRNPLFGPSAC